MFVHHTAPTLPRAIAAPRPNGHVIARTTSRRPPVAAPSRHHHERSGTTPALPAGYRALSPTGPANPPDPYPGYLAPPVPPVPGKNAHADPGCRPPPRSP